MLSISSERFFFGPLGIFIFLNVKNLPHILIGHSYGLRRSLICFKVSSVAQEFSPSTPQGFTGRLWGANRPEEQSIGLRDPCLIVGLIGYSVGHISTQDITTDAAKHSCKTCDRDRFQDFFMQTNDRARLDKTAFRVPIATMLYIEIPIFSVLHRHSASL